MANQGKINSSIGSVGAQGFDLYEDKLLDEIEKSTKRLHGQSKSLNEEATTHVRLLDGMKNEMEDANEVLLRQAHHAEMMKQTNDGVCWMYGVIIAEFSLLVTLLYMGMT